MVRLAVAALVLVSSSLVHSQTVTPQQVQLLAPQLLAFAGSSANLAALVSGLSQGTPVTLTTSVDGQLQAATFTPPAVSGAAEIARALETARTSLISRGIATPTAQQIAVALMGGGLPTPVGAVQVPGVLTGTANPAAVQVSTSSTAVTANLPAISRQGSNVTLGTGTQAQTFAVPGTTLSDLQLQQSLSAASQLLAQLGILNPTPEQFRAALIGGPVAVAGGSVTLLGVLQNAARNTSDSLTFGVSNSPVTGNTSNTPPSASGAIATPSPDTGIPRGNTAEGANRAIRRGG